jgi:hypothetical protein
MRIANALFALLFAFSMAVQLNDPDPLRWVAVYAAALAACVAWELRRGGRRIARAVGLASGVWALLSARDIRLAVPVGEALTDWHMHAGGSEELRETLGLALVTAWMVVIGLRGR